MYPYALYLYGHHFHLYCHEHWIRPQVISDMIVTTGCLILQLSSANSSSSTSPVDNPSFPSLPTCSSEIVDGSYSCQCHPTRYNSIIKRHQSRDMWQIMLLNSGMKRCIHVQLWNADNQGRWQNSLYKFQIEKITNFNLRNARVIESFVRMLLRLFCNLPAKVS